MNTFNMKQWLMLNKAGMYGKSLVKEGMDGDSEVSDRIVNRGDLEEVDPAALGAPQAAADAEMEVQDDENSDWLDTSGAIGEGSDKWLSDFEDALFDLQIDQPSRITVIKAFNKGEDAIIDQYRDMSGEMAAREFASDILGKKMSHPMDEYSSGEDHIQYDDEKTHMPFASEKPDPMKYNIQRGDDGKVIKATNQDGVTFKRGDTAKLAPQDGSKVVMINSFIEQQGKVKAIYSVRGTPYTYDIDGLEPVNPIQKEQMGVGYAMKTKLSDPKY